MIDVFESVFASVEALVYRCRNDQNYTMVTMAGAVKNLTGYSTADMIGNKNASWVGITSQEDKDRVFAEVDAAIEKRETWDVAYRIVHRDGHDIWVRERGNAIFEGDELVYLEGLIVGAMAERQMSDRLAQSVKRTQTANNEIVELSEKIAHSVKQLAMLSVNARIEAARVGDAGLGFAVVADEMKFLADQNGETARRIKDKIERLASLDSQDQTAA